MSRILTESQRAASDERKAKFRALAQQISAMSDGQRAELASRLSGLATIEGKALSLHNQCMIASQCPTATLVGGFRQWLNAGRCVRKGEHGYAIWVPSVRKSEGQPDEVRFMLGTVFDVAQTDEVQSEPSPVMTALASAV